LLIGIIAIVAPALQGGQHRSRIKQLEPGQLTGSTYTNDVVGVSYEIPKDWVIVEGLRPAPADPDSPMNVCTKVLLALEAPGKVKGRFNSFGALLVMDPACFSSPSFPQSLDKKAINKVVDKMFKPFTKTSFCSPFGATVTGSIVQGRVVIA